MSQENAAIAAQGGQSLLIKNLMPGLTERGKIKIGEKGRMTRSQGGKEFQLPQKLDHFRVTTLEKGPDDNYMPDREVHSLYGEKPKVLPVRLLYNEIDLNFQSRYCCYKGKKLWCAGDGEVALRLKSLENGKRDPVRCPCERQDPSYHGDDKCKINGCLSIIVDGVSRVGGVWKFRTTSYNSVVGIMSSLALIQSLTGGIIAGLPLQLTLNPKTAIVPTTGQAMQIWVVGLEFKGGVDELQAIGYERAKQNALHMAKMEQVESTVRKLIAHNPVVIDAEEASEIVEEFYPEQAMKEVRGEEIGSSSAGEGSPQRMPSPETEKSPQPPPAQTNDNGGSQEPAEPDKRRSRRNAFTVDPNVWNGQSEIKTCGSTPDQLLNIRAYYRVPEVRSIISDFMERIGYKEISFLRHDEAEELLQKVTELENKKPGASPEHAAEAENPQPASQIPEQQNPLPGVQDSVPPAPSSQEAIDDLVTCPMNGGDRLSKSRHCLVDCSFRKKDGFCPIIDAIPDGEMI